MYSPGTLFGSSRYVRDISNGLLRRGDQLTVLAANAITGRGWVDPLFGKYSSVKEETIDGIRVKRLKSLWEVTSTMFLLKKIGWPLLPNSIANIGSLFSAGPYLSNLKRELQNERCEVVHATPFPYGLIRLVWKACKVLNLPFICTPFIHFEDPRFKNPLLWEVLRDAVLVIACSRYEREGMIRYGISPSKIVLLPMGIYIEEWKDADGERFRRKYGLAGKRIILFAGSKSYDKGAIHLLRAARRLQRKVSDVMLVTVGWPTQEWSREKARTGGVPLLDLGEVGEEEKKDAFSACDLLAMPSRYEAFGITYLEAWRCAKPVIAAKVGAIPEIVEDGKDGLLVDFGDVDQLVSRIEFLLSNSHLRKEMGEIGRTKVMERFNWEKNIGMVETIFQRARTEWE